MTSSKEAFRTGLYRTNLASSNSSYPSKANFCQGREPQNKMENVQRKRDQKGGYRPLNEAIIEKPTLAACSPI